VIVDVHHANGDNADHRLANLITLCRPCHVIADPQFGRSHSGL
jgi:5-methylcytosine-specific restriction endonuclease McrA